jgi:hypothetical protein
MNYNIFLDDQLIPMDIFYKSSNKKYKEEKFIVVKSKEQFVSYIEEQFKKDGSYPTFISFDYYLAPVNLLVTEDNFIYYNDETYTPDGVECAEWVYDFCKLNNIPIPEYLIHDVNITGKRLIKRVFNQIVNNNL